MRSDPPVIDGMSTRMVFAMTLLAMAVLPSCVIRDGSPLDSSTMRPFCKLCPQNYYVGYPSTCSSCGRSVMNTRVEGAK